MPTYTNDPIIGRTTQPSGTENYNGGVFGESKDGTGVQGLSHSDEAGVLGRNDFFPHLPAELATFGPRGGPGVEGQSVRGIGVKGVSRGGNGGWFESVSGEGVRGYSRSASLAGVVGIGDTEDHNDGIGVYGKGGRLAAFFDGTVEVKGDIRFVSQHGDCAEEFDTEGVPEPGTVMVLGKNGALTRSYQSYDKRVAGVISGAGNYMPGFVLDKQESQSNRAPIGLVGKLYCKVDAQYSPIEVGDLLTTSATPGHAMKACDRFEAFGSIIGKALEGLMEGQGLIPILIALQ